MCGITKSSRTNADILIIRFRNTHGLSCSAEIILLNRDPAHAGSLPKFIHLRGEWYIFYNPCIFNLFRIILDFNCGLEDEVLDLDF